MPGFDILNSLLSVMNKAGINQDSEAGLNPLQENVLKTVKKVQSKQVEEAMLKGGVPAEDILKTMGIEVVPTTRSFEEQMRFGDTAMAIQEWMAQKDKEIRRNQPIWLQPSTQPPVEPLTVTPQYAPAVKRGVKPKRTKTEQEGLIGNIRLLPPTSPFSQSQIKVNPDGTITFQQGGFFDLNQEAVLNNLVALSALQEITGTKPLQQGEINKITLTKMFDLQNTLATKGIEGLNTEQGGRFALLIEGRNATEKIGEMLGTGAVGGSRVPWPEWWKSQDVKKFQSLIRQAIEAKLRIESGAEVPKHEITNAIRRYMPRIGDSYETAQWRLRPLYNFFNNAIALVDPQGIYTNIIQQSRQNAMQSNAPGLLQAIQAEKQRRGLQ